MFQSQNRVQIYLTRSLEGNAITCDMTKGSTYIHTIIVGDTTASHVVLEAEGHNSRLLAISASCTARRTRVNHGPDSLLVSLRRASLAIISQYMMREPGISLLRRFNNGCRGRLSQVFNWIGPWHCQRLGCPGSIDGDYLDRLINYSLPSAAACKDLVRARSMSLEGGLRMS